MDCNISPWTARTTAGLRGEERSRKEALLPSELEGTGEAPSPGRAQGPDHSHR